jgi:hypothetical protein
LLLVRSYAVDFDFTRGPHTISSVSLIRFDCREPGSTTHADLWRTRAGHLRVRLATVLFPYPAVTPEFLTQLDGFLAASGTDPGLARIVRDHRDTAERALRARTLLKAGD